MFNDELTKLIEDIEKINGEKFLDERLLGEFEEAIKPKPLQTLQENPETFEECFACFLTRYNWTDGEVIGYIIHFLKENMKMADEDISRFIKVVSVIKLRTYHDDILLGVAQHFLKWDPLILFLCEPNKQKDKHLEDEYEELIKKLGGRFKKKWASSLDEDTVEDVISDTIKYVIETAENPNAGYSYEGNFDAWLKTCINNRLIEMWRRNKKSASSQKNQNCPEDEETNYIESIPDSRQNPLNVYEYKELIQRYSERFILIKSFFRRGSHRLVKEIWAAMLLNNMDDKTLITTYKKKTGRDINIGTIATIRRRIRQRLDVINILQDLELEDKGTKKFLEIIKKWDIREKYIPKVLGCLQKLADRDVGDEALLEIIKTKMGVSENDKPTLRNIAALAKASKSEKILSWAIFSRYIVDLAKSTTMIRRFMLLLLRGRGLCNEKNTTKMEAALKWLQENSKEGKLKELRNETEKDGTRFFLPSCWYLKVIRGLTMADILSILNPSAIKTDDRMKSEEEWIKYITIKLK